MKHNILSGFAAHVIISLLLFECNHASQFTGDLPLFAYYPKLKGLLKHVSLGNFPTPIKRLTDLGSAMRTPNLYIKLDGNSGRLQENGKRLFGGNKVRKLEFLLADALYNGAKTILTFGGAGSNHVVATTMYARQLDLEVIAMLRWQPNAKLVQKNVRLIKQYGAHIYHAPTNAERDRQTIAVYQDHKNKHGDFPYIIPTGGSGPLGIVGFVNAAFELKEQIEAGIMPEPDRIYVPAGSFGTIAGLMLGIKIAKMKTKVIGVTVEPENTPGEFKRKIVDLLHETNVWLALLDESFELISWFEDDVQLMHKFSGSEYGLFIQEGVNAAQLMYAHEGIILDGTYTSKAFAALLDDVERNKYADQVILFWHTYCHHEAEDEQTEFDYKELPEACYAYFERNVQPLDALWPQ